MAFLDEIADRLVSAGVGAKGSVIFLGSNATIPAGDGPFVSLIETGGSGPTRIQNQNSANTQRPTAQILTRAKSYKTARLKAKQAYDALDGLYNVTLTGTVYHSIRARQELTDIGLDATGRPMIAFNIEVEKQPS